MNTKKRVRFADEPTVIDIPKLKSYKTGTERARNENMQNRLLYIEEYMRDNHLLFKHEYLGFTSKPKATYSRIGCIESVCRIRKWLQHDEHLKICL